MLAKILPVLSAALALAERGSTVESFLATAVSRLAGVAATGSEVTESDWDAIDQAAAANLTKVKGYPSLTSALLQTPSATPPVVPAADPPPADLAPGAEQQAG